MENPTPAQIRYAVRRIRRRSPAVFTLVALVGGSPEPEPQALSADAEFVQGSLRATLDKIMGVASGSAERRGSPPRSMMAAVG